VHDKQPIPLPNALGDELPGRAVTRDQIPALNGLAGVGNQSSVKSEKLEVKSGEQLAGTTPALEETRSSTATLQSPALPGEAAKPAVPGRTEEYFLPHNLTLSEAAKRDGRFDKLKTGRSLPPNAKSAGILYQPVLVAQASVSFNNRRYNLDHVVAQTAVVPEPDRRGVVRWQDYESGIIEPRQLDRAPVLDARFQVLEAPLDDAKVLATLKKDFEDWLYRSQEVKVKANETLKIYGGPNVSDQEFAKQCAAAAKEASDAESKKVADQFQRKIDAVATKLKREERELVEDEAEYSRRKQEEAVTHAETLFSLFNKRRRSVSSSMTKRRMTAKAKADVEESRDAIEAFKKEVAALEKEAEAALTDIQAKWEAVAQETSGIPVTPTKTGINVTLFGVAWLPHHIVQIEDDFVLLAGYA
jgi:hypothetical protein